MTNLSSTSTTTVSYEELMKATDPFAFTTESRSFGLSTEIQIFMCLLYGTLAFTAITSNMIVCYIVLSNQRMRTATNYFIVNLAVGDILMALFCIPFTFATNLIFQFWPFGLSLCVIVSYSQANSVFVSAYTMVAISIDKYLAIVYPMRLRMSKIQAKVIILVIWSAALLTSLPTALLSRLELAAPDFSPTLTATVNVPTSSSSSYVTPSPNLISPSVTSSNASKSQHLGLSSSSSSSPLPPPAIIHLLKSNQSSNTVISSHLTSTLSSLTTQEVFSVNSNQNPVTAQPQAIEVIVEQQPEQRKYFCQESWSFWPHGKYYYSMALMILQFVLPLFVLVITYSRIVIIVWGKRMPGEEDNARDARMARSKRKMIKMVIFCVIAFALTWLPFNALIVIGDVKPDIWEHQNIMYIWFTTHYLAMCHTITNPLIYIWMNNRFRAGFKQVIQDLYHPIRRLFIYLWYYCCCFACAFGCSKRKYSRVALDSSLALKANPMKFLSDRRQVIVTSGIGGSCGSSNNNNHNHIHQPNHQQQHLHQCLLQQQQQQQQQQPTDVAITERTTSITVCSSPLNIAPTSITTSYSSHTATTATTTTKTADPAGAPCSSANTIGLVRASGNSCSNQPPSLRGKHSNDSHYTTGRGSSCSSGPCKLQNLAASSASSANLRRQRQADILNTNCNSSNRIQETVMDGDNFVMVSTNSTTGDVVANSRLATSKAPIAPSGAATKRATTFTKQLEQHGRHVCDACIESMRTAFGSSRASGENNNDQEVSNISAGDKHAQQQQSRGFAKHIRAIRRLRTTGDKFRSNKGSSSQHGDLEQTSCSTAPTIATHKKKRRRKQSHMISIQMTTTAHHQQQAMIAAAMPSKLSAAHIEAATSGDSKFSKAINSKLKEKRLLDSGKEEGMLVAGREVNNNPLSASCNQHLHHKKHRNKRKGKKTQCPDSEPVSLVEEASSAYSSSAIKRNDLREINNKRPINWTECNKAPNFVIDMRQSSQSTATISMYTNTTSLPISPLNSSFKDPSNSTSASYSFTNEGGAGGASNKAASEALSRQDNLPASDMGNEIQPVMNNVPDSAVCNTSSPADKDMALTSPAGTGGQTTSKFQKDDASLVKKREPSDLTERYEVGIVNNLDNNDHLTGQKHDNNGMKQEVEQEEEREIDMETEQRQSEWPLSTTTSSGLESIESCLGGVLESTILNDSMLDSTILNPNNPLELNITTTQGARLSVDNVMKKNPLHIRDDNDEAGSSS